MTRGPARGEPRTPARGERGQATLLACVAVVVIAAVAGLLVLAGAARAVGERVRGAADLAALAGARAQGENGDACAAARSAARLNQAEVTSCRVAGDEVEFVVTVEVRGALRVGGGEYWFAARANAGMVTGAPE